MKLTKYMLICAALLCSSVALANTYTFQGSGNATDDPTLNVSADATVTTSTDMISITLNNLISNPRSASQLLTDFSFTLSGLPNASASSISTTGTEITVNSDGTFSTGPSNVAILHGWTVSGTGTITIQFPGGPPNHAIIGTSDAGNYSSGTYSNANNSITGNGPHNPFLENGATFDLSIAGVTMSTTLGDVMFSFGTEEQTVVPGTPGLPDSGSTAMLLGAALGSMEVLRRLLLKKR